MGGLREKGQGRFLWVKKRFELKLGNVAGEVGVKPLTKFNFSTLLKEICFPFKLCVFLYTRVQFL